MSNTDDRVDLPKLIRSIQQQLAELKLEHTRERQVQADSIDLLHQAQASAEKEAARQLSTLVERLDKLSSQHLSLHQWAEDLIGEQSRSIQSQSTALEDLREDQREQLRQIKDGCTEEIGLVRGGQREVREQLQAEAEARAAAHEAHAGSIEILRARNASLMKRLEGLADRILSLHLAFNEQITVQARAIQGQDAVMEQFRDAHTRELTRAFEQICAAQEAYERRLEAQESHSKELATEQLLDHHQLAALTEEVQRAQASISEDLEAAHRTIEQMGQSFGAALNQARRDHAAGLEEVHQAHVCDLEALREAHSLELEKLRQQQASLDDRLGVRARQAQSQERPIANLTAMQARFRKALSGGLEQLRRAQAEELERSLKRREQREERSSVRGLQLEELREEQAALEQRLEEQAKITHLLTERMEEMATEQAQMRQAHTQELEEVRLEHTAEIERLRGRLSQSQPDESNDSLCLAQELRPAFQE